MSIPITIVYEDELSEYVLTKIIGIFGDKFHISQSYSGNGFGYIKSTIRGFNAASKISPFFILTDLDNRQCPIQLIEDWLPKKEHQANLLFRVAVREVEALLIADIEGFSLYSGVSSANFPMFPDTENDPKQTLINIIRRSRKRSIREDIVPMNSNAKIGPNYNSRLQEFIQSHWNIENASKRSLSLKKAIDCLDKFNFNY